MKTVITYGTFDLLHNGHINLLKRAKELGDYLIVGITTDNYDRDRGKLNVKNDLMKRIDDVKSTGLADKIIIEEYFGQKIDDIQKYHADIFAIGSDWIGQFDYLKEFCKVIYIERTKGVSSTQLRNKQFKIINLGIIGSNIAATDFMKESKFVSGIEVVGVLNSESVSCIDDVKGFSKNVDAVYIGKSSLLLVDYIRIMLEDNKHILFEEPIEMSSSELRELYRLASTKSLVLLEAIKTAYCPSFLHLITLIKSNKIGSVRDIALSYNDFSSNSILPIMKLLGDQYDNLAFFSPLGDKTASLIRGVMEYSNAVATFKVGKGIKSDGSLIISGTNGYVYVPEPWWKTESFELRFDNVDHNEKYFYKLVGNGLRYVIQEFIELIQSNSSVSNKLLPDESVAIYSIIEKFNQMKGLS